MGSANRSWQGGSFSSGVLTTGVKWLLIANIGTFLFQFLLFFGFGIGLDFLKLIPEQTVRGFIWQPFTYMFLHSVGGASHILWNMVSLFLTGPMLERSWGLNPFLRYWLWCGAGTGILVIAASYVTGSESVGTIGCSGAIFGLLIAYAVLFPEILFFGMIKAKWFVLILGAVQIIDGIAQRSSAVSYVAHLGGMVVGFVLIRTGFFGKRRGPDIDPLAAVRGWYREWKLARARRKFEVYMRKQGRN